MKILSVDDSATIRKIIKGAVEVLGYDYAEAANGKEALDILRKDPAGINLVLLDWNMPVMDGFQTLTAMRADARLKKIPVMMVTTETERAKIVTAIAAGANHYVTKPFSIEDLTTRILECLGMGVEM